MFSGTRPPVRCYAPMWGWNVSPRFCAIGPSETTGIYAKVDFHLLKQVAQPWPEEALC